MEKIEGGALPEDYEIRSDRHNLMLFVYKNGVACRKQQKTIIRPLAIWFRVADRAKALRYARKHAELGLTTDQEVPEFEY